MVRVHVFCEGQTEETFVREVLVPHFVYQGCLLNPILVGGNAPYGRIGRLIALKCREDPTAFVTSMFDVFGLPADFPGMRDIQHAKDRVLHLVQSFARDIEQRSGQRNFIANLLVPEFEALLFSDPVALAQNIDTPELEEAFRAIRAKHPCPEDIGISASAFDESAAQAPSRRILALCPAYDKVWHGPLIALDIGLPTIRKHCPHFDNWLCKLEKLASGDPS